MSVPQIRVVDLCITNSVVVVVSLCSTVVMVLVVMYWCMCAVFHEQCTSVPL